jgi:eukaryotic-like serine/threonine-protein kinase
MLPESEHRAAQLAVSRFGAEATRVRQIYDQVVETRATGRTADLLDNLVQQKLLTKAQAQELRAALDVTQIDTSRKPGANGTSPAAPKPSAEFNVSDNRHIGDYRILRRLGEGGMGSVFLGYHEGDQAQVAIKVLPENLASNQAAIDRFYREAKSGALLNHPNIVRNLAVGQDQATGKHYLVMEYVDGVSALELLQRHGRLSVGDAIHIILDVARALEHAHSRNIVHRDIKPDNVLITQSGLAKLSDLGLAKRTDEASHLTAARQGFGTPYYMPFEQAMNAKYADGRSDIFALGATLYHLVAGEVPFPGTSHVEIVEKKEHGEFPPARSHNAKVPAALDVIMNRMMAREPADRYQTVSELIVDLERSELAAKVPSFIDPDQAMRDPLVRERLTTPAQPTAADLQMSQREPRSELRKSHPDIWYLRYQDPTGRWCKAKATTQQVLKRLREGRFTSKVEASHQHGGPFKPLGKFEEFTAAPGEVVSDNPPSLVTRMISAIKVRLGL